MTAIMHRRHSLPELAERLMVVVPLHPGWVVIDDLLEVEIAMLFQQTFQQRNEFWAFGEEVVLAEVFTHIAIPTWASYLQ
ncbi:hypothetical protein D3C86_1461440 [compost metagenome]